MNVSNLFFSAIDTDYYAITKVNADNNWFIQIANGSAIWSLSLTPNEIEESAKAVSIKKEKYGEDLLDSLSGRADSSYSFFISNSNNKELKITWKRNIKGFANVLGIFSANIQQDQIQLSLNIFNDLDVHIKQLHQKIFNQDKEINQLKIANEKAVKKYEESVKQFETLETKLMEKFSAVLNSKKRKIRELEDDSMPTKVRSVEIKESSPETTKTSSAPNPTSKTMKASGSSKAPVISDSDATDISDSEDIFPKGKTINMNVIKRQPKPQRITRKSSRSAKGQSHSDTSHNADDLIDCM